MPQDAFFQWTRNLLVSQKMTQRHFFPHPPSPFPVIFATAAVVAFVLLRNSRFNFHRYTQHEATPNQKSARKWHCDLSQLLARKITKGIHSCKSASLNRPIWCHLVELRTACAVCDINCRETGVCGLSFWQASAGTSFDLSTFMQSHGHAAFRNNIINDSYKVLFSNQNLSHCVVQTSYDKNNHVTHTHTHTHTHMHTLTHTHTYSTNRVWLFFSQCCSKEGQPWWSSTAVTLWTCNVLCRSLPDRALPVTSIYHWICTVVSLASYLHLCNAIIFTHKT